MNFINDLRLENYILSARWDDFPEAVKERAVVCSIDLMMALILGSKGNQFKAGVKLAKAIYKDGNVSVIGSNEQFNFIGAATVMGHASNSFDIDDGHNMIKGHPGTSIIGGILAAALERKISYKEFLTTLVVAYETAIRNGLAIQNHYGFLHSTGAYGAVGTSAGVGRIFGLDKEKLNNAISIADFHAPMTPVMRAVEYPSMNKDGVPYGVLVGSMAVLDTLCGELGKTHTLELKEYSYLIDSLGSNYEIMNLYFKPFTCCRWAHPAIIASHKIIREHSINVDEIEEVYVHTFLSATKLSKIVPKTTDEAQYNIAFPIAVGILDGDVGIDQVMDSNLNRSNVIDFMKKIKFVVNEEIEKKFPGERLCKVELVMKNGRNYMSEIVAAIGESSDNVDIKWIVEKFKRVTKTILKEDRQNEILHALINVDGMTVNDIVNLINSDI